MEIPVALTETLLKFRYHALSVVSVLVSVLGIIQVSPNFLTVLNFFSPLLASTALFLVAAVVISRAHAPGITGNDPPTGSSCAGEASSSCSSPQGFDERGYFERTEGEERGLLESVAQQQEGGRLALDGILE